MTGTIQIINGVGVIGGRPIEHAEVHSEDFQLADHVLRRRQILCSFLNGWKVSIVFGTATYSSNGQSAESFTETPTLVETAVINPEGDLTQMPGQGDTVMGFQTADEVLALIRLIESFD